MPYIKLKSSDNIIFTTDIKFLMCSGTIRNMLEVCGIGDAENIIVPLPNVRSDILFLILKWATYHIDDPQPIEDYENKQKRCDDVCSWDVEFLKVEQAILFELITAANYLDIKALLDVTCKTVANMIKGKSTEQIRENFNISNDFTPAEMEEIRKSFELYE